MKGVTPLLRATDLPADPKVYPGPLATPVEQTFFWAYDRPKQRGSRSRGAASARPLATMTTTGAWRTS